MKYLKIFNILLIAFLITGCDDTSMMLSETANFSSNTEETLSKSEEIQNNNIYIITDPDTGVQYIVYREKRGYAGFGGITPRLNPDGSLYVVQEEE